MIGSVTDLQAQMLAVEKGRRKRMERERQAALTAAHQVAQAEMDEGGEDAQKGFRDRGALEGPGTFTEPAAPAEPSAFRRPFIREDHAATSPQFEGPRVPPLPPGERGTVTQVQRPAAAVVAGSGPGVQSLSDYQARVGLAMPVPQPPRGGE